MKSKEIAQQILDDYPEITSDEIKFLAQEHLRLLQQAKPGEADITLPSDREKLRPQEGFDD